MHQVMFMICMLQMFLSNENERSVNVTDRNNKVGETGNDDTVVQYHHCYGVDRENVIHSLYDGEKTVNLQFKNEDRFRILWLVPEKFMAVFL